MNWPCGGTRQQRHPVDVAEADTAPRVAPECQILERVHLCEVIHVIIPQLQAQHASQEKPQKAADAEEFGSPSPPHQSINLLAVG
ncbi:hypothetical protein D4764_10G0006300 [Takifugu flavidus]|uniref:Uncharacterized protein n=1 Tax=Takifugu flavidus TaxID=433684 RepID=A0A5C6PMS8_9TELE|nr:hypothetical protein D4764_10G0006300 [Takifugu flavidus]